MSDFTEQLGNGIKKALGTDAVSSALNGVSSIASKAKSFLTGQPSDNTAANETKANNVKAVQDANDSFKPKTTPKAKPVTPVKKGMPSFKEGTISVPKTGPAQLHKGEMVIPKEHADNIRGQMNLKDAVKGELSGEHKKGPKIIKHIITKKSATPGHHIHTHVHTHPDHPDEDHTTVGDDQMAEHMMQNMGTPNPGEAEADPTQASGGAGSPPPTSGPMPGM